MPTDDLDTPQPRAPIGRAGAALAGAAVVALTLFAWRGVLSARLFADDYSVIERAREEDLATSLWVHGPGYFTERGVELYFRPLWRLAAELVHTLGGEEPRAWFATALALHVAVVLALYALAAAWTRRPWLAAAAASAFALAPAPAQAVAWPAAALNTPPAALLLLGAGAALWAWLERGRKRALAAALAALVVSLGFREAGYQLAPLALAGALVLPWARWRALAAFAAIAAVVALHFGLCNAVEASESGLGLARATARNGEVVLRDLYGVDAPGWLLAAGTAVLGAAAWRVASPRSRFVLAWAACALFPYVVKHAASRFQYLFHAPLWLAAALVAADAAQRAQRGAGGASWARGAGVALLAALAAWNAARLPAELARYERAGTRCASALASLTEMDLAGERVVAADLVPHDLQNAVPSMLRGLGVELERFVVQVMVRRPPFLLYAIEVEGAHEPPLLAWQESTGRYRKTTLAQFAGPLVPLPMFGLRHRARVVAGPAAALAEMTSGAGDLARDVWLYAEPPPPAGEREPTLSRCALVATRPGRVVLQLESDADGWLVLHVPGGLDAANAVLIDGRPAELVPADGPFRAARVAAGRHEALVTLRAFGPSGEDE